jgi:hypothetical protein
MDGQRPPSILTLDFYGAIGRSAAPLVFDVRRSAAFDAADRMLAGAQRRAPDEIGQWVREVPTRRPVVIYYDAFYAWC